MENIKTIRMAMIEKTSENSNKSRPILTEEGTETSLSEKDAGGLRSVYRHVRRQRARKRTGRNSAVPKRKKPPHHPASSEKSLLLFILNYVTLFALELHNKRKTLDCHYEFIKSEN
jgi:hypothetical protein